MYQFMRCWSSVCAAPLSTPCRLRVPSQRADAVLALIPCSAGRSPSCMVLHDAGPVEYTAGQHNQVFASVVHVALKGLVSAWRAGKQDLCCSLAVVCQNPGREVQRCADIGEPLQN
jgi:hypothetical protein